MKKIILGFVICMVALPVQAGLKEALEFKSFPKTVKAGEFYYGVFDHKKGKQILLVQPAFYSRKNLKIAYQYKERTGVDYVPVIADYRRAASNYLKSKGCKVLGTEKKIGNNSYTFQFTC
jgi:hypothetical protein